MSTFPKRPNEMTSGMMWFPRMLDKVRLHDRGELPEDYHGSMGKSDRLDGACCNFLRINYVDLRERVLQGNDTDEQILEWCFERGRRPNDGDIRVWNAFASKLGWRDFASAMLEKAKERNGIAGRTDIVTIMDLIDFDEGRHLQHASR